MRSTISVEAPIVNPVSYCLISTDRSVERRERRSTDESTNGGVVCGGSPGSLETLPVLGPRSDGEELSD